MEVPVSALFGVVVAVGVGTLVMASEVLAAVLFTEVLGVEVLQTRALVVLVALPCLVAQVAQAVLMVAHQPLARLLVVEVVVQKPVHQVLVLVDEFDLLTGDKT